MAENGRTTSFADRPEFPVRPYTCREGDVEELRKISNVLQGKGFDTTIAFAKGEIHGILYVRLVRTNKEMGAKTAFRAPSWYDFGLTEVTVLPIFLEGSEEVFPDKTGRFWAATIASPLGRPLRPYGHRYNGDSTTMEASFSHPSRLVRVMARVQEGVEEADRLIDVIEYSASTEVGDYHAWMEGQFWSSKLGEIASHRNRNFRLYIDAARAAIRKVDELPTNLCFFAERGANDEVIVEAKTGNGEEAQVVIQGS